MSARPDDIAIVGMSATFAGAADLASYWQNIVDKVDAVTEADDAWSEPFYDPDADDEARIYTRKGGFLKDLAEFSPLEFGIMPNAVDGGEPDQYLALKMASLALKDAGYDQRPFDRSRAGVILGRGTYVNRGYSTLMQHGMMVDQTLALLKSIHTELSEETMAELRGALRKKLPPFTAEMCPGLVPNLVTGRIANRLDLMGPNFIVDAACASSLIAIELAIRELRSGRCDVMLTGGVHASTPPQIYMIFCQLNALSRSNIRPFDEAADGVLLGEGVGVLMLKRLADAERDGDRIYALVKGVGCSSDGKALGMLAPRLEGEVLALERAYEAADVDPASIGLIEAHGTGISLGDQTEIKSLSTLFGERDHGLPHTAIGSVKSMISHCIPAAGAAGTIKTALALHHKILPPTLCERVNPSLGIEATTFYVNNETRPWVHGAGQGPRRAGVNSFGFGGINAHVVLEEYVGENAAPGSHLHARWPSELFLLAANDDAGMLRAIEDLTTTLTANEYASLASLAAAHAAAAARSGAVRLALAATGHDDLAAKLAGAKGKIAADPARAFQTRNGVFYGRRQDTGKVAFLFPGEGSQYGNMLADLCLHFPGVRKWFDFLDDTFAGERDATPSHFIFPPPTSLTDDEKARAEAGLFEMDLGSEAVFTASMALHELLAGFGIACDAMVGHSTGENTALVASGVLPLTDRSELGDLMRRFNRIYRELLKNERIPKGVLMTVGAVDRARVDAAIAPMNERLHVAMDNCPNQVVLFGDREAVDEAARSLGESGALCAPLPFDRAYHTPLFEGVADAFMTFYRTLDMRPGHTPVFSCTALSRFPESAEAMRTMAARQWASQVRFREAVEQLHDEGYRTFVEIGPSSNLTSFVRDILRKKDHLALGCDSRRRGGIDSLLELLARLFVRGASVDPGALYANRQIEPLVAPEPAAGTRRTPPPQRLELNMPVLSLPEALSAKLRRQAPRLADDPAPADRASHANTFETPAAAAPAAASPAPGTARVPPTAPAADRTPAPPPVADLRSEMLEGHFDLMREFLENQRRVMGRLTTPDVHAPAVAAPPGGTGPVHRWPMLGDHVSIAGDQLTCMRRFDLDRDLFLRDHTLGGSVSHADPSLPALAVVPFTFTMELIAEAAHRLLDGAHEVSGMRAMRGYRWLTLDPGHIDLRVHATAADAPAGDGRIVVAVRVWQTNVTAPAGGALVFEGDVLLGSAGAPAPAPFTLDETMLRPCGIPDADLYTTGMFHGPALRGVRHLRRWSEQGIEAELEVLPTHGFFDFTGQPALVTDAGLTDAAGQLVGYWLSEQFGSDFNCFPFRVASFEQYAPPLAGALAPGARILTRGLIRFTSDTQIHARFDMLDQEGRLIARLDGWEDRYFRIPQRFYEVRLQPASASLSDPMELPGDADAVGRRLEPFPEHFLDDGWAIWKRVLAHLVLGPAERAEWLSLERSEAGRSEWLLGRIAAKDAVREWAARHHGVRLAPADVAIRPDAQGKPEATTAVAGVSMPQVSIAHSDGLVVALAVHAGQGVGIDVEPLKGVRVADLVRAGFDDAEKALLAANRGIGEQRAAIAMWCAKEAAAKAAGTGLQGDPRRWQVLALEAGAGTAEVHHDGISYAVSWRIGEAEVVAVARGPRNGNHAVSLSRQAS